MSQLYWRVTGDCKIKHKTVRGARSEKRVKVEAKRQNICRRLQPRQHWTTVQEVQYRCASSPGDLEAISARCKYITLCNLEHDELRTKLALCGSGDQAEYGAMRCGNAVVGDISIFECKVTPSQDRESATVRMEGRDIQLGWIQVLDAAKETEAIERLRKEFSESGFGIDGQQLELKDIACILAVDTSGYMRLRLFACLSGVHHV